MQIGRTGRTCLLTATRTSLSQSRSGLSLIELLVVILVLAALVILLLPAIQSAREASRRIGCTNNLKQMGIALHAYHDAHGAFPYGGGLSTEPKPSGYIAFSWSTFILPHIEQDDVYSQLDFNYWPASGPNIEPGKVLIPTYQCPSAPANRVITCTGAISGADDAAETNYSATATYLDWNTQELEGLGGGHGVMFAFSHNNIRDITDGLSKTLMVGEIDHDQEDPIREFEQYCPGNKCWVGRQWCFRNMMTTFGGINSNPDFLEPRVHSHHPGGAQFLFADGVARFIGQEVDQDILRALTTSRGGELITGEF